MSLRSTDPFDTPVVNTNLFGSPGEAETMVQCLEKEREVLAQMPANFNMSELPRFPETITPADVRCPSRMSAMHDKFCRQHVLTHAVAQ